MTAYNITIPPVTFKVREETDESPGFAWKDLTTEEVFANRRVVLFGLPGAWTPTCSSTHVPGYIANYDQIKDYGIDEVYCTSVNDSFTMNAWFTHLEVNETVKPLPDGSGEFARKMGFLVKKDNLGFGDRSWRYSMVVNDGIVERMFIEPGMDDNVETDMFVVSDAISMVAYLEEHKINTHRAEHGIVS